MKSMKPTNGRLTAMKQLWEKYQAGQPLTKIERECLGLKDAARPTRSKDVG